MVSLGFKIDQAEVVLEIYEKNVFFLFIDIHFGLENRFGQFKVIFSLVIVSYLNVDAAQFKIFLKYVFVVLGDSSFVTFVSLLLKVDFLTIKLDILVEFAYFQFSLLVLNH